MTIASDLLQRHIQTLVDDNTQWQTLIADDVLWELAYAPSAGIQQAVWAGGSGPSRNLVHRGCGVHCYKEIDSVISARKATRREVRFYEEGI